jgi:hypothetical protein
LFCHAAAATVDISDIGVGARPLGMGKATVAGLDDATALFSNPAALTLNPNLTVTSMSGKLLSEVNYLMLGGVESSPFGRVGVGYITAGIGGIPITSLTGTGSTAAVSWESNADYYSSIIFLTYGTELSRMMRGQFSNVSLGASLKYFLQGFSGGQSGSSNPLLDANGNGMDMDLGVTWQTNSWLRFGLAANNCLPVSLGGKFTWRRNGITEGIPMALRLGGNLKLLGPMAWRQVADQRLDINLEYETGRGDGRPAVWHTGVEFWPTQILTLRAGLDQKPKATESGAMAVDNNLTAGIGILFAGFSFDYAYHQYGDLSENTTHFFSFGYRGSERAINHKTAEKMSTEKSSLIAEVVPKPALNSFTDVTGSYWARQPIEYLTTMGVMSGYPDNTFKPESSVTRDEFVSFLAKAKNVSPEAIARPNQNITRAEAAVLVAKFAGLTVKKKVSVKPYKDIAINYWAAPAIAACKLQGYYAYLAGQKFNPGNSLTRGEAAEIISKTPLLKRKIKNLITMVVEDKK